jgi:hypothetical protein
MASYSDISGSSEAAVVSKNRFNRTSLPGNDDVGIDRTEYRDDSRIQTSRDCYVPRSWIEYTTVTRVTVIDMRILMHRGLAGWARSRVMATFETCGLMLDSNVSLIDGS